MSISSAPDAAPALPVHEAITSSAISAIPSPNVPSVRDDDRGGSKRKPRDPRVFDVDGREVFITLICPHCRKAAPLKKFGLRRMGNGQIRNAPWCKACRGAGTPA
jgi:hypothetical protein